MADRADLAHHISKGQKARTSREQIALEIGAKPVAHHRNPHVIGDGGQLPDLCVGQELRLVHHHAGKLATGMFGGDKTGHVAVGVKHGGSCLQPDARPDPSLADTIVKLCREQHGIHPALAVIVRCLQKDGAFAGIHCGIGKIELGHDRSLENGIAIVPPAGAFVNGKSG